MQIQNCQSSSELWKSSVSLWNFCGILPAHSLAAFWLLVWLFRSWAFWSPFPVAFLPVEVDSWLPGSLGILFCRFWFLAFMLSLEFPWYPDFAEVCQAEHFWAKDFQAFWPQGITWFWWLVAFFCTYFVKYYSSTWVLLPLATTDQLCILA